MAGERIGNLYEALIKVSLDHIKSRGFISEEIFWNKKPKGITVNPDFTIGKDADHPKIVIMSTHSSASKNSDMKCWRNIGELCELKPTIIPMPLAINIIFDATFKETLLIMQEKTFDKQLVVSNRPYGGALIEWVAANVSSFPSQKERKVAAVLEAIQNDEGMKQWMGAFEEDILSCLKTENNQMNQLWSLDKTRIRNGARESRQTFIRRGLSKILIFDDVELAIRLYRGELVTSCDIPQYVYDLGFAKKVIGRVEPSDEEIKSAFEIVDDQTIREIYHSMDENQKVHSWIMELRHSEIFQIMGDYIYNHYEELCNPISLLEKINQLYHNPSALVTLTDTDHIWWPPENVWLVVYILELIKAFSGKANGYGSSQLADDVIAFGYGTEEDKAKADQFGGGLGFLSWLYRKPNKFRADLLEGVATVLANKLESISAKTTKKLIQNGIVTKYAVNNILEAKLCSYRYFDPIYHILQHRIKTHRVRYRTCFGEVAQLTGAAGKVQVEKIGDTLIRIQSATEKGHDHKRNELCGRAVGLRYSWDDCSQQFIARPEVKKLVLIIDGYWSNDDISSLINCGWDEIYYPDELELLSEKLKHS